MKALRNLLAAAILGASSFASADSVDDYLKLMQATLNTGNVASFGVGGTGSGLASSGCSLSFELNSAKDQLLVAITEKQFGGFSLRGLYLFLGNPNTLIFNKYKIVETKIDENSETRLAITSKFVDERGTAGTQQFSYDKITKKTSILLNGNKFWGGDKIDCQIN